MRYDVVAHHSIGPVQLGMSREAVTGVLGDPMAADPSGLLKWSGNPFSVEFRNNGVWFIGAATYQGDSFVLDEVELSGRLSTVEERLRRAGFEIVVGDPIEPGNRSTRHLPQLDVRLWSNELTFVDEISVVGSDYWTTAAPFMFSRPPSTFPPDFLPPPFVDVAKEEGKP